MKKYKRLTEHKVIICDYLNAFFNSLHGQAFCKPYLCPNFEEKEKGK